MAKETARPDVAGGRLTPAQYAANFADIHPPLARKAALVEANRCYFCHDAPCLEACPTGIDIPGFIKAVATDNVEGAALKILDANIFGGACARVCPTEVLCEGVCVREAQEGRPIQIGRLQRYATDDLFAKANGRERPVPASASPSSAAGRRASPALIAWRCSATTPSSSRRSRGSAV